MTIVKVFGDKAGLINIYR